MKVGYSNEKPRRNIVKYERDKGRNAKSRWLLRVKENMEDQRKSDLWIETNNSRFFFFLQKQGMFVCFEV